MVYIEESSLKIFHFVSDGFKSRQFDKIWRFHGKNTSKVFAKKNMHFFEKLKVNFNYIFSSNSETTKARSYCYSSFERSDPKV